MARPSTSTTPLRLQPLLRFSDSDSPFFSPSQADTPVRADAHSFSPSATTRPAAVVESPKVVFRQKAGGRPARRTRSSLASTMEVAASNKDAASIKPPQNLLDGSPSPCKAPSIFPDSLLPPPSSPLKTSSANSTIMFGGFAGSVEADGDLLSDLMHEEEEEAEEMAMEDIIQVGQELEDEEHEAPPASSSSSLPPSSPAVVVTSTCMLEEEEGLDSAAVDVSFDNVTTRHGSRSSSSINPTVLEASLVSTGIRDAEVIAEVEAAVWEAEVGEAKEEEERFDPETAPSPSPVVTKETNTSNELSEDAIVEDIVPDDTADSESKESTEDPEEAARRLAWIAVETAEAEASNLALVVTEDLTTRNSAPYDSGHHHHNPILETEVAVTAVADVTRKNGELSQMNVEKEEEEEEGKEAFAEFEAKLEEKEEVRTPTPEASVNGWLGEVETHVPEVEVAVEAEIVLVVQEAHDADVVVGVEAIVVEVNSEVEDEAEARIDAILNGVEQRQKPLVVEHEATVLESEEEGLVVEVEHEEEEQALLIEQEVESFGVDHDDSVDAQHVDEEAPHCIVDSLVAEQAVAIEHDPIEEAGNGERSVVGDEVVAVRPGGKEENSEVNETSNGIEGVGEKEASYAEIDEKEALSMEIEINEGDIKEEVALDKLKESDDANLQGEDALIAAAPPPPPEPVQAMPTFVSDDSEPESTFSSTSLATPPRPSSTKAGPRTAPTAQRRTLKAPRPPVRAPTAILPEAAPPVAVASALAPTPARSSSGLPRPTKQVSRLPVPQLSAYSSLIPTVPDIPPRPPSACSTSSTPLFSSSTSSRPRIPAFTSTYSSTTAPPASAPQAPLPPPMMLAVASAARALAATSPQPPTKAGGAGLRSTVSAASTQRSSNHPPRAPRRALGPQSSLSLRPSSSTASLDASTSSSTSLSTASSANSPEKKHTSRSIEAENTARRPPVADLKPSSSRSTNALTAAPERLQNSNGTELFGASAAPAIGPKASGRQKRPRAALTDADELAVVTQPRTRRARGPQAVVTAPPPPATEDIHMADCLATPSPEDAPTTPSRPMLVFKPAPSLTQDELTQLTQRNTRKNKVWFNKLDVQTIHMDSNRPPSPTSKIRRVISEEGSLGRPTTKEGREARAAKRRSALRSSLDGSEARLSETEIGEDEVVEPQTPVVHFRAAGDEEQYRSPVRKGSSSKGKKRSTAESQGEKKRVKWDRGLVYEGPLLPQGETDGILKKIPLDQFGNSTSTSTGFAKSTSVCITKIIYLDDE